MSSEEEDLYSKREMKIPPRRGDLGEADEVELEEAELRGEARDVGRGERDQRAGNAARGGRAGEAGEAEDAGESRYVGQGGRAYAGESARMADSGYSRQGERMGESERLGEAGEAGEIGEGMEAGEAGEVGEAGEAENECLPPPEEEKELLFLIEFLIDTMLLKPEHMKIEGMDPCLLQGQTCVVLTFLHYPSMSICENDVDPCRQTGGNYIKFNAGKSLMFALSESQFENPPPIYLEVCAYKMLPHGSVPNKLPIGMTKICLVELFKQVFEKVDEKPDKLPLSKSIKDKYQLIGVKKCPTAEVTIYIRLSCLGQNVVTEFQRGGDECEPFLFKNKESKKVYECKPKDMPVADAEELCPPVPGWGASAGKDCGDGGGEEGAASYGAFKGTEEYPKSENFNNDDEFDEFGTEVLGHALTIKVQKSQKRHLGMSDDGESTMGKTKSSASTRGGKAGNQITFQVPPSQSLCNKSGGGNKADVYNVDTIDGKKCVGNGPFQIVQGEDSPDKDVFLLRIGKKGETYGKGKLELELRTPKIKIERPIHWPRRWDKAVQTEKDDTPKKKKGKKKKK